MSLSKVFERPSYFNQSKACSIYHERQLSIDSKTNFLIPIKFNLLSPYKTMIENHLKSKLRVFE